MGVTEDSTHSTYKKLIIIYLLAAHSFILPKNKNKKQQKAIIFLLFSKSSVNFSPRGSRENPGVTKLSFRPAPWRALPLQLPRPPLRESRIRTKRKLKRKPKTLKAEATITSSMAGSRKPWTTTRAPSSYSTSSSQVMAAIRRRSLSLLS